jgi:hypothetical protein
MTNPNARTVTYSLIWGGQTFEVVLPEDEMPEDAGELYDRICMEAGVDDNDEPRQVDEFIHHLGMLSQ